jgi:hypothetical protein
MPAGVGYGPQDTFAGTGKFLITIGSHCYHYSGAVDVDNTDLVLTKFKTGQEYIVAKWYPSYGAESTDNMRFSIYFNDVQVTRTTLDSRVVGNPFQWNPLVIPPLTEVEIVCTNKSTSTPVQMYSTIIGRIYGKIE